MSVVENAGVRPASPSSWPAAGTSQETGEFRPSCLFDAARLEPRALLDRLAATEARERTLIAEAIHDDPLQLIVAAIMQVDVVRTKCPAAQQDCDKVGDLLQSAVEKLRALIVAAAVPNFDSGLASVLRRLATGIFIGTSTAVRLTGTAHVPLTADAQIAAYRIVREALVNVRTHAFARHVSIDVSAADNSIVITVADDGVGCERPRSGGGHLGLPAMHSRARAVAGRFRISSTRGVGTTVTVTLPRADPRVLRHLGLRVFLVGERAAGRQDLAELVEDEQGLSVVGQASSIADAMEQIPLHEPDVLVTDAGLRDGSGVDLYARVRKQLPQLHCVILASTADAEAAAAAVRSGVHGYLSKATDPADVMAAVRAVAGGRSVLDGRITEMLADRLPA